MTRLPVDSWDVKPRFDIPPYELNTICPVTGEVSGLEDHHIWRRSFTALGEDNVSLFWVEYFDADGDDVVVKNRIALSPEAHARITTNRARLEYRHDELWYVEGEEEKKLDLSLRLMEGSEKVSKPRRKPKATTPEERKARVNYSIRTPAGEENVLPELEEALRDHLKDELAEIASSEGRVSSYKVWHTVAMRELEDWERRG